MRRNPIVLTDDQGDELHGVIKRGKAPVRQLPHARVLLNADQGRPDAAIIVVLHIHPTTAWWLHGCFIQEDFASALRHNHPAQPKPPAPTAQAP